MDMGEALQRSLFLGFPHLCNFIDPSHLPVYPPPPLNQILKRRQDRGISSVAASDGSSRLRRPAPLAMNDASALELGTGLPEARGRGSPAAQRPSGGLHQSAALGYISKANASPRRRANFRSLLRAAGHGIRTICRAADFSQELFAGSPGVV